MPLPAPDRHRLRYCRRPRVCCSLRIASCRCQCATSTPAGFQRRPNRRCASCIRQTARASHAHQKSQSAPATNYRQPPRTRRRRVEPSAPGELRHVVNHKLETGACSSGKACGAACLAPVGNAFEPPLQFTHEVGDLLGALAAQRHLDLAAQRGQGRAQLVGGGPGEAPPKPQEQNK